MTDKMATALQIIKDNPGIRAKGFGLTMWPDGAHHRHSNGGNGSQAGKGMWLCAGSYLSKLYKAGMIEHVSGNVWEYKISRQGLVELEKYNNQWKSS